MQAGWIQDLAGEKAPWNQKVFDSMLSMTTGILSSEDSLLVNADNCNLLKIAHGNMLSIGDSILAKG